MLILAPFIILVIVVFVAIKFADHNKSKREGGRSCMKGRFIGRHRRTASLQSSQTTTDSDPEAGLAHNTESHSNSNSQAQHNTS